MTSASSKLLSSKSTLFLSVISTAVALYLLNTTSNFARAQEMMVTSQLAFLGAVTAIVMLGIGSYDQIKGPLKFFYSCFLKPLGAAGKVSEGGGQQSRLESFYKDQAEVYDETRGGLLRGRRTMIALAAAQLKQQMAKANSGKAPVWIDIGGGTGWNIEQMNTHFPISKFERVYLVDLCPSLCRVARERFQKRGWTNVVVLCEDAVGFTLPGIEQPENKIELLTLSYSLSMMDNFYAVVDRVYNLLEPNYGIIGVSDFYVSGIVSKPNENGLENRACNWFTRNFWKIWFEFDHVHLHPARREYLEHKFATTKSINGRNQFLIPYLVQIPFYIWIGEKSHGQESVLKPRLAVTSSLMSVETLKVHEQDEEQQVDDEILNLTTTPSDLRPRSMSTDSGSSIDSLELSMPGSPASMSSTHTLVTTVLSKVQGKQTSTSGSSTTTTATATTGSQLISKSTVDKFGKRMSQWRLSYDPTLECHTQFRSYIYAFTWEDPRIDLEVLDITSEDTMFVITSAGDNALEYAIHGQPKRIHCIDMNPCQNHLLELKLASIQNLTYSEFWSLFGEGQQKDFRRLLTEKLSPFLSSPALQFWYKNSTTFDKNFYETGYSGLAIRLIKWIIRLKGLESVVKEISETDSIQHQADLWNKIVKPSVIPEMLVDKVFSHPAFLWNALGVPINQMNMFLSEGTAVRYMYDTMDSAMERSLFKNDQYFYNLVVNRRYTPESCPSYLSESGFKTLKENSKALGSLMLHTKSIIQVLKTMKDGELTKCVLMDHMDWFDAKDAEDEIKEVARAVAKGGKVLWRSAGRIPWYNALFEKCGFKVEPVGVRVPGSNVSIDRVNMYASCYIATRL